MRRFAVPALLLACDVVLGWLNYHAAEDVQVVAAALFVFAFGFAVWRPRSTWYVIPLLWFAIPVSGIVADANNYHPGLFKPHPLYETLVALIPTVAGAVFGLGARWFAVRVGSD